MIDPSAAHFVSPSSAVKTRNVLTMRTDERMAGSIPVWGKPVTARAEVQAGFSTQGDLSSSNGQALVADYAGSVGREAAAADEFGFWDLLDVVNPLQHLPVVNSVYREVTGDSIKPANKVIGGALFGGPLGAASSLANVVLEAETGRDLTGHAAHLAFGDEGVDRDVPRGLAFSPPLEGAPVEHIVWNDHPEVQLNRVAEAVSDSGVASRVAARDDFPGALLSFVDLREGADVKRARPALSEHNVPREAISEIQMRPMPASLWGRPRYND